MHPSQIKQERRIRNIADDAHVVAAVMPNGVIKWLRWGVAVGSPHLRQSTIEMGGELKRVVNLSDRAVHEGWHLLADLFAAEGLDREWASYEAYMAAGVADRNPGPFPERDLPRAVIAMREAAAAPAWTPLAAAPEKAAPEKAAPKKAEPSG